MLQGWKSTKKIEFFQSQIEIRIKKNAAWKNWQPALRSEGLADVWDPAMATTCMGIRGFPSLQLSSFWDERQLDVGLGC
jgi:hypothetical protein